MMLIGSTDTIKQYKLLDVFYSCNIEPFWLEHRGRTKVLKITKTLGSRPRPRPRPFPQDQDQDQDLGFKTKTKTKTFYARPRPRPRPFTQDLFQDFLFEYIYYARPIKQCQIKRHGYSYSLQHSLDLHLHSCSWSALKVNIIIVFIYY